MVLSELVSNHTMFCEKGFCECTKICGNIFSMSALRTNWCIRYLSKTSVLSICNYGPIDKRSFRDLPDDVAHEALKTNLNLVMHSSSRSSPWCGRQRHLFREIRYELNGVEIDRNKNVGASLIKGMCSLSANKNNLLENANLLLPKITRTHLCRTISPHLRLYLPNYNSVSKST